MNNLAEIRVPDIGGTYDIDVVEVAIKEGDLVSLDQNIVTLESDKASMDLPASAAGTVQHVYIKVGDKISAGTLIATVLAEEQIKSAPTPTAEPTIVENVESSGSNAPAFGVKSTVVPPVVEADKKPSNHEQRPHASPSVRFLARELGVDLSQVAEGSGRKGRILNEDVKSFVKMAMTNVSKASTISMPDFSEFGEVIIEPLSKINRIMSQRMTNSWINTPMVTYHDEIDITDMESFRAALNTEKITEGVKYTGLSFIMMAVAIAMQQFPRFNSSLSNDGEKLILKKYFNIGVAVDTPNGLVVPVLRDVISKSIKQLVIELSEKSDKARAGKLSPTDMQGGCITISNLGGIGGRGFTPIINSPEVAILGVTQSKMQPFWNGDTFVPRLMLPIDLTYDHRVIDGAEGARFIKIIKYYLCDIRRLLI